MDRRLAIILLLLLASGTALTLAAYEFGVFKFDLQIAAMLRDLEAPVFEALMAAISFLGDGWVPVIIVLAVAAFWAFRKGWLEAAFVIATLSAGVLAGVLKVLVGRPRPSSFTLQPRDLFESFNQYAYPSGHVLIFVVFYGLVAYLSWKYLEGRSRWGVIAVCAALILLIGPSRIVMGEHWASDVIGSYIIGTLWLIILVLLYLMVLFRRNGEPNDGSVP
ncbi:MAG: phosphatase PAP2 family protein [Methanomicrobiales archaeon]|nr:phosphatase PAP2 family protein [Methanomicrobiales archaeon]